MRILGIDVGLATTGWSVTEKHSNNLNRYKVRDYGVIETKPKIRLEQRLKIIYKELNTIIEKYEPEASAVEGLFYFSNQKTVMQVSQARGVILLALANHNLEVFSYTPLQVKTAVTGYGRATKEQVQKMVMVIAGLKHIPEPDDAADAIAITICHLNS